MSPDQKTEDRDRQAGKGDEVVAKDCLREKQVINSLTTPMPGRIMM